MDCFSYDLPRERIAQRPVSPPEAARMLVVHRSTSGIKDLHFADFPCLVGEGDLLVFNNSKVIAARFFGSISGSSPVELLLLEESPGSKWLCIGRPLKKFKQGAVIDLCGDVSAVIGERVGEYTVYITFLDKDGVHLDRQDLLLKGCMPIPPYIRNGVGDVQDRSDYQTSFAKVEGSIAAPTAGLHFSPSLIEAIGQRGCEIEYVTLHVGTHSFLPLHRVGGSLSRPGRENYLNDSALLNKIMSLRQSGGRVIAVGTTCVRALESMARQAHSSSSSGAILATELFIQPGFSFKAIDALVTNFHQPDTSHLQLVEAFLGRPLLERCYSHALRGAYRFLSYGDGMFLC
ncbi:MAG: tRNA preQ1(34) S-adenosylmethionine ribosyltransferase-isomerase QueA [Bdellovibrionales bacterium]|nr:tRNA preQ1(34) S-adenosylmethionine ribosyltransferase-isomerase QueA [Bdellovibrionales bacterium]